MTEADNPNQGWVWLARIRRPQGRKGEVFAEILTDFPEKFADRRHLWLLANAPQPPAAPSTRHQHPGAPSMAGAVSAMGGNDESSTRHRHPGAPSMGQSHRPMGGNDESSTLQKPPGAPSMGQSHRPMGGNDESSTLQKPPGAPSMAGAVSAMGGNHQPRQVELTNHWLHKGGIVLHFAGVDSISAAETLAGLIVAIPANQRAPLAEDEFHIADLIGCTVLDVSGPAPREIGKIHNVDRTAGPVPLLIVEGKSGEVLIPFAKAFIRRIDLPAARLELSLPEGLLDLNS